MQPASPSTNFDYSSWNSSTVTTLPYKSKEWSEIEADVKLLDCLPKKRLVPLVTNNCCFVRSI